jgi:hypothetical protein
LWGFESEGDTHLGGEDFDKISERPVSVAGGVSYSLVISAGLAVVGVAAYVVGKELVAKSISEDQRLGVSAEILERAEDERWGGRSAASGGDPSGGG